jgi:trehalose 6-phosphate phosphatase
VRFRNRRELAGWALASSPLWLFLDYDGTLKEFAPTPAHVKPDPEIVGLLESLARRPETRLTIISGRRLPDVRHLVPLSGILIAGSYGMEILTPEGQIIQRGDFAEFRPTLDALRPRWEKLIQGRQDFYLEDKGWTLALHGRWAGDAEAESVLSKARNLATASSRPGLFQIVNEYKFVEVAPKLANKKAAVTYLLEQYALPDARLLYIGDDDKDEEAFSVVQAHGGAGVRVLANSERGRTAAADFVLDSPSATLQLLRQLL